MDNNHKDEVTMESPPVVLNSSFSRVFDKQNVCMETAIKSLDNLNDQLVQCIFSPKAVELGDHELTARDREKLKGSMALMRRLLVEAQHKFRKMVEDNKRLASRIDTSILAANQEVSQLKAELADTSHKMMQISQLRHCGSESNIPNNNTSATERENLQLQELDKVREENNRLRQDITRLEKELQDAKSKATKASLQSDEGRANTFKLDLIQTKQELSRAHEALQAMKADRKRLKSEKLELLSQMKQLYCTLEDKEAELRDFIRSYEMRMRENDEAFKQMTTQKISEEKEKWNAVREVGVANTKLTEMEAELSARDSLIQRLQGEIVQLTDKLKSAPQGQSTIKSTTSSSSSDSVLKSPSPHCQSHDEDSPDNTTATNESGNTCTLRIKSTASLMSTSSGYHGSLEHIPRSTTPIKREHLHHASHRPASMNQDVGGGRPLSLNQDSPDPYTGYSNTHYNHEGEYVIISNVQLKRKDTKKRSKSPGGPLTRIFGKSRSRRSVAVMESGVGASDVDSPDNAINKRLSVLSQENYQEKLCVLEASKSLPMCKWKANHVLAWMEIDMNMPLYGRMCGENIKSGKVLLGLSDSELDSALDLKSSLHRRKLRLAIEEHREPGIIKFPSASTIDHTWIAHRWAPDLGLPQYSAAFEHHLVDGRLLNVLTKKDLEKYLGIHRKFHQISVLHAIELLRRVNYDKEVLLQRRSQCETEDSDALVWTNHRLIKWINDIDLNEYVGNLKESGVHGAVLVLEPTFTAECFASVLAIPPNKSYVRRHLATEFEALVRPARAALDAHSMSKKKGSASLGRESGKAFTRSFTKGGQSSPEETPVRRLSFRGSLSRALGKKVKDNLLDTKSTSDQSVAESCDKACDQNRELSGTIV